MEILFEAVIKIGERRYRLEYKRREYDVVCSEYIKSNGDAQIVIPDFLNPKRKYPVFVYFYAINLYSSRDEMSQRAVAEATRKKFGLTKFSHSTVCRTFKALELSIEEATKASLALGNREKDCEVKTNIEKAANTGGQKRSFPSIGDTSERRRIMSAFIRSIVKNNKTVCIIELCRDAVKYWYDRYGRLLI